MAKLFHVTCEVTLMVVADDKHHAEELAGDLVRVEDDGSEGVVDQADGQPHHKLATARFAALSAQKTRPQYMKLCLAHRALETQQQPVVKVSWIVNAILVQDQRLSERRQLEQAVPVGVVACQARDLKPEDDPGMAECHLADQMLEAVAVLGMSA